METLGWDDIRRSDSGERESETDLQLTHHNKIGESIDQQISSFNRPFFEETYQNSYSNTSFKKAMLWRNRIDKRGFQIQPGAVWDISPSQREPVDCQNLEQRMRFQNIFSRAKDVVWPLPLFHCTHHKAGSSWLYRILKLAFQERVPERSECQANKIAGKRGDIYGSVFCSHDEFLSIDRPKDSPHFFVIRDIRDTMTSMYFSLRYSHVPNPDVKMARLHMENLSDEEGLLHCFQTHSPFFCNIQKSWIDSPAPVYRYEDLFETEGRLLLEILDDVGFKYDSRRLAQVIAECTFEKEFNRKPGETDIHSHGRSGVAGSWKQYRTPELDAFIEGNLSQHIRYTNYEL